MYKYQLPIGKEPAACANAPTLPHNLQPQRLAQQLRTCIRLALQNYYVYSVCDRVRGCGGSQLAGVQGAAAASCRLLQTPAQPPPPLTRLTW